MYRPPEAVLTAAPDGQIAPGQLDVQLALGDGWNAMVRSFPTWLGIGLVFHLVLFAAAVTGIGLLLLVPVLAWGGTRALLELHDGRGRIGDIFSGFADYGSVLVVSVAWYLCHLGLSLVGQAPQIVGDVTDTAWLSLAGAIVSLVWSFAVMIRLNFAYLFVVDRGVSAVTALRLSWECTRGQTLRVLLLVIASMAVGLMGLVALIVGVIPAGAVIMLAWASAYRQLTGTRPSGEPAARL